MASVEKTVDVSELQEAGACQKKYFTATLQETGRNLPHFCGSGEGSVSGTAKGGL